MDQLSEETSVREQVLDKAKEYVLRDRNRDYDTPEKNFETIAAFWNVYWSSVDREEFSPHDVAIFMDLVKTARIATSPQKMDHWEDKAGYAACGAECVVEHEERHE